MEETKQTQPPVNIPPQTPPTPQQVAPAATPPPARPRIKVLYVIIIIAILVLIGSAVAAVMILPQSTGREIPVETMVTPTAIILSPTEVLSTSESWATFTNKSVGYSVSYPANFKHEVGDDPKAEWFRDGRETVPGFVGKGFDIYQKNNMQRMNSESSGNITVDGVEAPVYYDQIEGITVGPFKKNNRVIEIKYFETGKELTEIPAEFQKILDSFRFSE